MKQTKIPFFIRIKNAIFNFDTYQIFASEKVSIAIKYILKIVLIFSIILSAVITYKFVSKSKYMVNEFEKEGPDFRFENNNLIIEDEQKQFIKADEDRILCNSNE